MSEFISPLADLLDAQQADVVMSRGLFIYFDKDTITLAARNIFAGLKPNGHFITDLGSGTDESISVASKVISLFRKQTKSDPSRGRVASLEEGEQLFRNAGYTTVKIYHFSDFEDKLDLPQPYLDLVLVIDAQRAAETEATAHQDKIADVVTTPETLKPSANEDTETDKETSQASKVPSDKAPTVPSAKNAILVDKESKVITQDKNTNTSAESSETSSE